MSMENVRYIDAYVDIYYGNEETSEIKSTVATQEGTPSRLEDLYRTINDLGYKAFTLEESFTLGEGRGLVDKIGWWGTVLSSAVYATENNGYPFPANDKPCLIMEFAGARIIRKIDIFGDRQLDEYPSRFKLTMYDESKQTVYSKTFANNQALSQVILNDDGSYLSDDDGRLIRVRWLKLELIAWNKPKRLSKLYRFYDDIVETYKNDDIKEFDVVHEKVNNGSIKYGLCSDSCTVSLYNKDRKFDRGYLRNMIHLNKMIVPHINGKRLGNFYIKEWSFSQDGMFVKCSANDRLMDFQTIIYPGRMPYRQSDDIDTSGWDKEDEESLIQEKETQQISFYRLFKEVLDFAASSAFMRKFDYEISPALKDYYLTPFVKEATVWVILQKLCDATLSHVYINENDVLIVETALPAKNTSRQTVKRKATGYRISAPMEADYTVLPTSEEADNGNGIIEINMSNAFSMDIPYFADMVANEVEVGYYTRKVGKASEDLLIIPQIILSGEETKQIKLTLDDIYTEVILVSDDQDKRYINKFNYDSGCSFVLILTNLLSTEITIAGLVIKGKKVDFEKTQLPLNNTATDMFSSRYPYIHPDSEFIQSAEYAELLRNRIMECYPEDTKSSSVQWRGDLNLGVSKMFELENRFKEKELYSCTYSKISVQGGMRQETKGVLIKDT